MLFLLEKNFRLTLRRYKYSFVLFAFHEDFSKYKKWENTGEISMLVQNHRNIISLLQTGFDASSISVADFH